MEGQHECSCTAECSVHVTASVSYCPGVSSGHRASKCPRLVESTTGGIEDLDVSRILQVNQTHLFQEQLAGIKDLPVRAELITPNERLGNGRLKRKSTMYPPRF